MSGLTLDSLTLRHADGGGISTGPLAFAPGRLTVLLGPNGAGKSSLIKVLAGVAKADCEGLRLDGAPVGTGPARARQIAYLSQTRIGPALASVRDVISLGRFPHGQSDPDDKVGAVMEQLALTELADRRFGTLSGGEQARVLLGRALAVDAPVLLADEPTASLDPHYALRILQALKDEARRGRVVVVSLHDLSLAERFGDDAVILDRGHVAKVGTPVDALDTDLLRHVFRIERTDRGDNPV